MQLYLKNIRGPISQNLLRVMGTGRNQQIRVLGVTIDLALIDPCFIRLCGQRYHGFLDVEENSKRKLQRYYGKDWARTAFEGLQTGDFIYYIDHKLRVMSVPCFEPKKTPEHIKEKPTPMKSRIKALVNKLIGK